MFDESRITKAYPYDNKYVKKCYIISKQYIYNIQDPLT